MLSGARIAAHPKAIPAIEDPTSVWKQSLDETKETLKCSGVPALTVQRILFERRFIPVPQKEVAKVNIQLSEETIIDLGSTKLQVIYTPGHSQDCVCLYDADKKILFSGDHILKRTTPHIWNLTEYIRSLEKVSKIDATMMLPGHEALIYEPRKRIDELMVHHANREQAFLDLINGSNGKTIYQLSIEYWGHLPGHHLILALNECRAHLEKLVDENRAKVEEINGVFHYIPSV
jgi:glyoxylase-like metal-dependent hydrolase (beta-lactamase superfamily II)